MKRNNVILGSVGIVATAALFAVSPWKSTDSQGTYTQEGFSAFTEQSADDVKEWLERKYIDHDTGERITEKKLRQIKADISKMEKSRAVTFFEQGPDNIGGRTRAIQVDVTNNNIIWAGGVSGGLFKSMNGANLWERVESYELLCSPYISSMAQFTNGTLFVATGSLNESWGGDGVWYTQDQGATWEQVPGTASLSSVTEIVAPENGTTLWLTTTSGLRKWNFGDATLTPVSTGSGGCSALACSPNGQIIIAASQSNTNATYVSTDFGATFENRGGNASNNLVPLGANRIEYAVSQSPNSSGNYSLYAVRTASNLLGMHVSHDSGATWTQFVGSSGTPSNLDIYRNQGTYNSVVTVTPQNAEKILIGGIDVWKWQQTSTNPAPPTGGFEKLSEWAVAPISPIYVHADNHEFKWDGTKLYIGNDGGIGVTYDPETAFYPANRGYNVTQFYGIAFDRHGSVLGGTQDNGTLYNDHTLSTFQEFRQVSGGDGIQCEISFYNPAIMFATSQRGVARRSGDFGQTFDSYVPNPLPNTYDPIDGNQSNAHPFQTSIHLAEYFDENSEDSVIYTPSENSAAGETIKVPSAATGDTILYTLTAPLYFDDTLNYDPALTVMETSVVNELTGQTIFLGLFSWVHLGTSGSGLVPPIVGDTILVDVSTGTDTVVVESTGMYARYAATNSIDPSLTFDMGIDSILFNVAWNTVTVQDPYQSWYFHYINENGGELWGTRNALRLSAQDDGWGVVARGIGGSFGDLDIEFSRDMNHIYIATGSTVVHRIDGLGSVYTSSPTFEEDAFFHVPNGGASQVPPNATTRTTFTPGGSVQGLGLNPADEDDLVVVSGFSSNNIKRSTNATDASPSFSNVPGIPGNPGTYDVVIDREDDSRLVVGTSHGVFVSENSGTTWEDGSIGFCGTPVYEVRQSWRTWDEGNFRPGEIHIGTYGRGIWSTDSFLSTDENSPNQADNGPSIEEFDTNLFPYPNPTTASTSLSFELANASDVTIQVYNLSGRLVKTINKKNMSQGSQVLDIQGGDLSTGTYIVKLFAGKQEATTKFVKM